MRSTKGTALVASLLVVVSVVGAAAPIAASQQAQQSQQAEAYTGTHVSFDTGSNAVVDYAVNGETIVRNVTVQSKSEARSGGGISIGVDLSAVTELAGARISSSTTAATHATIGFESGAEMQAHDNGRGVLVLRSGGESQFVQVGVSSDARAEQESENRVVVTNDNGTQSTFLVVGDGQVTVNQEGNVSAEVGQNGKLVYRQYEGERTESDEQQEQLIAEGKAAAEVYVQRTGEGGQETAADVVQYSEDTSVEVTRQTRGKVNMTVDRAESEGKVVITTVSEQVFESTEDIQVQVDGEAAARADSYAAVSQATRGGDTSKFLVRQSSSAEATADVVVGINHFSTRSVTMTSDATPTEGDDGGDGDTGGDGDSDGDNGGATDGGAPGFGPAATVLAVALLAVALYARRRV